MIWYMIAGVVVILMGFTLTIYGVGIAFYKRSFLLMLGSFMGGCLITSTVCVAIGVAESNYVCTGEKFNIHNEHRIICSDHDVCRCL